YQYLGVSNRAFVMRADIDLDQLEPSSASPAGLPLPGTHWFDLNETRFGVFQSNGNPVTGLAWSVQPSRPVADHGGDVVTLEIALQDYDPQVTPPAIAAFGVKSSEFIRDGDKYVRDVPYGGATGEFAVVTTMSD